MHGAPPPPSPPPPIITECERCHEIAHNCRIEKSQLPVSHTYQAAEGDAIRIRPSFL
jgi:hypothetical protein